MAFSIDSVVAEEDLLVSSESFDGSGVELPRSELVDQLDVLLNSRRMFCAQYVIYLKDTASALEDLLRMSKACNDLYSKRCFLNCFQHKYRLMQSEYRALMKLSVKPEQLFYFAEECIQNEMSDLGDDESCKTFVLRFLSNVSKIENSLTSLAFLDSDVEELSDQFVEEDFTFVQASLVSFGSALDQMNSPVSDVDQLGTQLSKLQKMEGYYGMNIFVHIDYSVRAEAKKPFNWRRLDQYVEEAQSMGAKWIKFTLVLENGEVVLKIENDGIGKLCFDRTPFGRREEKLRMNGVVDFRTPVKTLDEVIGSFKNADFSQLYYYFDRYGFQVFDQIEWGFADALESQLLKMIRGNNNDSIPLVALKQMYFYLSSHDAFSLHCCRMRRLILRVEKPEKEKGRDFRFKLIDACRRVDRDDSTRVEELKGMFPHSPDIYPLYVRLSEFADSLFLLAHQQDGKRHLFELTLDASRRCQALGI